MAHPEKRDPGDTHPDGIKSNRVQFPQDLEPSSTGVQNTEGAEEKLRFALRQDSELTSHSIGTDDGEDSSEYDWSAEEDLVDEAAKFESQMGKKGKSQGWTFKRSAHYLTSNKLIYKNPVKIVFAPLHLPYRLSCPRGHTRRPCPHRPLLLVQTSSYPQTSIHQRQRRRMALLGCFESHHLLVPCHDHRHHPYPRPILPLRHMGTRLRIHQDKD